MAEKSIAACLLSYGAFLIPLLASQAVDLDSCGIPCFLLYLLVPSISAAIAAIYLLNLERISAIISVLAGWFSALATNQVLFIFPVIQPLTIYLSVQYLLALMIAVASAAFLRSEEVAPEIGEELKVEEGGELEAEVEPMAEEPGEEEFITCPYCGRRIPADSIYCPLCGGRVKEEA